MLTLFLIGVAGLSAVVTADKIGWLDTSPADRLYYQFLRQKSLQQKRLDSPAAALIEQLEQPHVLLLPRSVIERMVHEDRLVT